jgi:hypothetical protein
MTFKNGKGRNKWIAYRIWVGIGGIGQGKRGSEYQESFRLVPALPLAYFKGR